MKAISRDLRLRWKIGAGRGLPLGSEGGGARGGSVRRLDSILIICF